MPRRSRAHAVLRRRPHAAGGPQHQLSSRRRLAHALLYASDRDGRSRATRSDAAATRAAAHRRAAPEIPLYNVTAARRRAGRRCGTSRGNPTNAGMFWNVHEWDDQVRPCGSVIVLSCIVSGASRRPSRCCCSISLLVFALIHAAPGGPLAIYLDNPERPARGHRAAAPRARPRPAARGCSTSRGSAAFVRGRLGIQLHRRATGRSTRILERRAGDARAGRRLARAGAAGRDPRRDARRGSARTLAFDRIATGAASPASRFPVFWFGLLLQLVFAVSARLASLVRAHVVRRRRLSSIGSRTWSCRRRCSRRCTRPRGRATCARRCIDVLAQPFIVAARARGVPERARALPACAAQRARARSHRRPARCGDHGVGRGRDRERLRLAGRRQPVHRGARPARLHRADGVSDARVARRRRAEPRWRT